MNPGLIGFAVWLAVVAVYAAYRLGRVRGFEEGEAAGEIRVMRIYEPFSRVQHLEEIARPW